MWQLYYPTRVGVRNRDPVATKEGKGLLVAVEVAEPSKRVVDREAALVIALSDLAVFAR